MRFFHQRERKPDVRVITKWSELSDDFYAPGVLIQVRNGKGILRNVYAEMPQSTYCTLMFKEQPLFQFQGDEYYCPTCEKVLKSGYGLEQTCEFHMEKLNQNKEKVDLSEALEELKPLLGLMRSGYYIVLDTKLYPTDGNGHLFWGVPNEDQYLPGTCIYHFREKDCEWGNLKPYFAVATQPVEKLCQERVTYYRQNPGCRAVAFFEDGYMTALLDGHHKAMAAALEHKMVNTLVIIPCFGIRRDNGKRGYKEYISGSSMEFSCEKYHLDMRQNPMYEKISEKQMKEIFAHIPKEDQIPALPYNEKDLAGFYPTVEEIAYIDLVREITDERLDRIVQGRSICSDEEACDLMKAMIAIKHERTMEIADFFLNLNYCGNTIYCILEVLTKLPHSDEIEQYLIEQMVEYEQDYPYVKDIVLNYF